jgi:hypothetical protein
MFSQLEAHLVHRFGAAVAPLKAAISDFDYEVANQLLAELVEAERQESLGQSDAAG